MNLTSKRSPNLVFLDLNSKMSRVEMIAMKTKLENDIKNIVDYSEKQKEEALKTYSFHFSPKKGMFLNQKIKKANAAFNVFTDRNEKDNTLLKTLVSSLINK